MAAHGDLEPAAECRAVQRRDDQLLRCLDRVDDVGKHRLDGWLAELGDVRAGAEGAAAADDQHGLAVVALRRLERIHDAAANRGRERVDGRVVDTDDADPVDHVILNG